MLYHLASCLGTLCWSALAEKVPGEEFNCQRKKDIAWLNRGIVFRHAAVRTLGRRIHVLPADPDPTPTVEFRVPPP